MKGSPCFRTEASSRGKPSTFREAHGIVHQLFVLGQTNQPTPRNCWTSIQQPTGELLALGRPLHLSRQPSLRSLSTNKHESGRGGVAILVFQHLLRTPNCLFCDRPFQVFRHSKSLGMGGSWTPCGLGEMVKVLESEVWAPRGEE